MMIEYRIRQVDKMTGQTVTLAGPPTEEQQAEACRVARLRYHLQGRPHTDAPLQVISITEMK